MIPSFTPLSKFLVTVLVASGATLTAATLILGLGAAPGNAQSQSAQAVPASLLSTNDTAAFLAQDVTKETAIAETNATI